MPARRPLVCSIAFALASALGAAHAYQLDYSLSTALGYSDNIAQSATDQTGQGMLIPRLDFDWREDGSLLRARVAGQIEYRDYLQGAYGNEFRGRLTGIGEWLIVPGRLRFDVEDYAAVQPVNLLAPNAPSNQQQTNVFTLGPTLNFHLPQALDGQAELRASESSASQTHEFDSTRASVALRALRSISHVQKLSANVEYEEVHFTDRNGGPDYHRADAFARYQSKLSQLDIDVAAGWSRLEYPEGAQHSGALLRGALNWRATPSQTFTLSAARQFADASADLVVDPAAWMSNTTLAPSGGIVTGTTPISSQVYLERRVDAAWAYQSERLRLRVEPYVRTLDYLINPVLDENARGLVAGVSYRPRPLWTVAFDVTDETRRFDAIARHDEDRRYDLSFTDQLARQWSVRLDLIRNERHSNVALQGFRENVAFCSLIYKR